jgi:hypothetical protein
MSHPDQGQISPEEKKTTERALRTFYTKLAKPAKFALRCLRVLRVNTVSDRILFSPFSRVSFLFV